MPGVIYSDVSEKRKKKTGAIKFRTKKVGMKRVIFPDLENNISDPGWLEGRANLAPTNSEV